jgi:hypothetical protein
MTRSRRDARGVVTAEAALVLPALLAVTLALVWLLAVGAAQIRAVDAARETARALARGDDPAEAVELGTRVAPPGSAVSVVRVGEEVRVTVTGPAPAPGGVLGHLPTPEVRAEAVALVEER